MLETGIQGRAETLVSKANTAASMGSGNLEVFATPCMVALMEEASQRSVAPFLGEGESTVGTKLCVSHDAATPVGMKVTAEATVTEVNGRETVFEVTASDEKGLIGKGTHKRFTVYAEKFMSKTNSTLG